MFVQMLHSEGVNTVNSELLGPQQCKTEQSLIKFTHSTQRVSQLYSLDLMLLYEGADLRYF